MKQNKLSYTLVTKIDQRDIDIIDFLLMLSAHYREFHQSQYENMEHFIMGFLSAYTLCKGKYDTDQIIDLINFTFAGERDFSVSEEDKIMIVPIRGHKNAA